MANSGRKSRSLILIDLAGHKGTTPKKSIDACSIPVGLLSIATFLNRNLSGLEITVLDREIDFDTSEQLLTIIREKQPEYIGFRALSLNHDILVNLTEKIRNEFSNMILIVGGPHVSGASPETLLNLPVDAIVIGEGELTSLELFSCLMKNESFHHIKGIAYRKKNRLIVNAMRPFIVNLDDLPFPDYNLINFERYANKPTLDFITRRAAYLETSRGCPFNCAYCRNIFGKKSRLRSPDSIFEYIMSLHKRFAINDFFFVDDIFNINYQRSLELFETIIESRIKIRLHFQNGLRGDLMDKNLIKKMARAGTVSVAFAVETPSPRLKKYINKNLDLLKLEQNINYACDYGIIVRLFFMYGFPTETEAEVEETLSYMKQFKKCVLPLLYSVKYFKNTRLYSEAVKSGFQVKTLEESSRSFYHEFEFFETPLLSRNFVNTIYWRYIREVIFDRERMENAITIQKEHYCDREIMEFYSRLFRKKFEKIEKILDLCNPSS